MLKSWKLSLCLTASVFAILAPRAASAQEVGTLTGVIKDAAGTTVTRLPCSANNLRMLRLMPKS